MQLCVKVVLVFLVMHCFLQLIVSGKPTKQGKESPETTTEATTTITPIQPSPVVGSRNNGTRESKVVVTSNATTSTINVPTNNTNLTAKTSNASASIPNPIKYGTTNTTNVIETKAEGATANSTASKQITRNLTTTNINVTKNKPDDASENKSSAHNKSITDENLNEYSDQDVLDAFKKILIQINKRNMTSVVKSSTGTLELGIFGGKKKTEYTPDNTPTAGAATKTKSLNSKPTEDAAKKTESPDKPSEDAAKKTESPDKPSEDAAKKTKSPDKPSEDAAKKTKSPDKPTEDAAKKTKSPDKPNEGGAKKTTSSNKPTEDSQASPDSGHFAIVFLVLIAALFALYALYHNRQKIVAIIMEGRPRSNGARERYRKLNSNLEDVEPRIKNSSEVYVY